MEMEKVVEDSKPARVQINADDLIQALETNNAETPFILDLETGKILFYYDGYLGEEEVDEDFDIDEFLSQDRYQTIMPLPSSDSYHIMEDFVESLPDGREKDRLYDAITGSKPFRKFKDAVDRLGDTRDEWFKFRDEAWKGLAAEWLRRESIDADLV